MDSLDVTPTNETLYQERRGRVETDTGVGHGAPASGRETPFVRYGAKMPVFLRQVDGTATTEEVRGHRVGDRRAGAGYDAAARDPRDVRLALLARKYDGKASVEDSARLQILTERVRKLAPRVTSDDVDRAAEMVADAEGIAGRLEMMKARLGLR